MGHEAKALKARFWKLDPSAINDALVDEHIRERRGQGRSDGTIWTELGHLRIALSWAVKKGLIEKAPYIKRPAQPAPKADYLTREQFNQFLAACDMPHMRRFAILAITTGARASAILDLTWDRVDFQRGLVIFKKPTDIERQMKGRALVPMNATLRAALKEGQEGALSEYVIEWAGQKVTRIVKGFRAAAHRAGLPFVTPHVMRHSAAVWMAEAGVDFEEIAQYLGHSDSRITARVYARFSPTHLRKAASVLDIEIPTKKHLTLIHDQAHNVQHGNDERDADHDPLHRGRKDAAEGGGKG
jgi:integrase